MTKKITTFFTSSGTPQTGLSATIRIRNGAGTLVITDAAMTEIGDGFYGYDFTTYDEEEEYSIRCDGSASLTNALDRYTYAGNESYMEDVLDASIVDHDTAGTVGSEIMSGGGVVLGNGNGNRSMTMDEMKAVASEVWKFIFNNEETAEEVLLSRSSFNAIKDRVLLKEKIEIPKSVDYTKEFSTIASILSQITSKVEILASKPAPTITVDVPISLVKDISSISKIVQGFNLQLLSETVDNAREMFVSVGDELRDKVESLVGQLSSNNLDLSGAAELADALTTLKDSLTTILVLADRMGGDTQTKRALKSTLIQLTNLKFKQLESNLRK